MNESNLLDFDEDWACTHCAGEGLVECDDWIQCTYRGCDGEMHPCTACRGSGLGKDQSIW